MRHTPLLLVLPLLASPGCNRPVEAPDGFTDLCAWIFSHQADEDPAELVAGLEQLATWLQENPEATEDGYEVSLLSEATMDALDEQDRTAEDMVGLALARESRHPVWNSSYALVAVNQQEIFPDTFEEYEREYISGPDCFVEETCESMEATEHLVSSFLFGVASESDAWNQYRWAEMSTGTAMVHRNWQIDPPEVNFSWLEVDEQTYLNAFVPTEDSVWRLQAQWTVYDPENDVPEETAKGVVITSLENFHDKLEAWLDENDVTTW